MNSIATTKYDVIWIGGSHGDIDQNGKPTQFNGCTNRKTYEAFLKDLRDVGIKADYIIADFCFSLAFLPELYRLLESNGVFVGWASICGVQRHAELATKSVKDIVIDTETNIESIFQGTGSGQVVYRKQSKVLIRYDSATLKKSMATIDASSKQEQEDAMAGLKRIGKKRVLTTRIKTKRLLKCFFGVYYLTPDLVGDMDANVYNSRTQFVSRIRSFL